MISGRGHQVIPCSVCGKPVRRFNSTLRNYPTKGTHCSYACKAIAMSLTHGESHPSWKGGRVFYKGRPAVRVPSHPRANKQGYVYENIVVAEKVLGRPLKYFGPSHPDNEVPHHRNNDPTDNRNTNLLICTSRYHKWLHGKMRGTAFMDKMRTARRQHAC